MMYRCQIDHRYSLGSLLHAMESNLERALWSATVLLKQTAIAYEGRLDEDEMVKNAGDQQKLIRRRIDEVRKQFLAIHSMIESSHAVE